MKLLVIPKARQVPGAFDGGRIRERKLVAFPQEGGLLHGFSSLLYWSHAWSENGGTIALHPHQGFEIVSYVVEGSLEHFDTAENAWSKLEAGSVQIMRAGRGLEHEERAAAGCSWFQIWFDPNLRLSLPEPPTYNDYPAAAFPEEKAENRSSRTLLGEGSPVAMRAPARLRELRLGAGTHKIEINSGQILTLYVFSGKVEINENFAKSGDLVLCRDSAALELQAAKSSLIYTLETPVEPGYPLYLES